MIAQEERSLAPLTTCWRSIKLIAKKPYGPFNWKQNDFMDNFMFNQDKDSNGLKGSLFNGCDRSTWIHALLFHRITLPPSLIPVHFSALGQNRSAHGFPMAGWLWYIYRRRHASQQFPSKPSADSMFKVGTRRLLIKKTMASYQWGLN